jgi:hypothetical protein
MLMLLAWGVATDQPESVTMIEAVAAFLGLISTGIFVAHAVEAYAHASEKPGQYCIGHRQPLEGRQAQ